MTTARRRQSLSRSEQMSRIRGKDTKPELLLRRELWRRGLRYRLGFRTQASRPDLVFRRQQVAVFIDGCFWHGCPEHYVPPRSRRDFWEEKLRTNVDRDRQQTKVLEEAEWTVLRFWECQVHDQLGRVVGKIQRALEGQRPRRTSQMRVVSVEFLDPEGRIEKRLLEDLRHADRGASVVRERSTRKWKNRR